MNDVFGVMGKYMTGQWYTVFCKPCKDFQVANYLQSNDIKVYHPTLKVKPVNPRASKIQSYFPRYLFICADLDQIGISALKWTPGSVGLVEFDSKPAIVPDPFIKDLRNRIAEIEAAGGLHLDGLKQGDPVLIKSGAFARYDAIFDLRLNDQERIQVLLYWLGRETKVQINANAVEKRHRQH